MTTYETEAPPNDQVAADIGAEAAATVLSRDSHGDAVENHEHIASLWSAFLDHEVEAWEAAAMLSLVKLSRAKTGQLRRDHLVDLAGYSGIAWACAVATGQADPRDTILRGDPDEVLDDAV